MDRWMVGPSYMHVVGMGGGGGVGGGQADQATTKNMLDGRC